MCVASENIVPNAQEMSLPANEGFNSTCQSPSQTHTTQGGPGLNEEGGGDLVSPVGMVDPCMCPLEWQRHSPAAHLICDQRVPPASQSHPPRRGPRPPACCVWTQPRRGVRSTILVAAVSTPSLLPTPPTPPGGVRKSQRAICCIQKSKDTSRPRWPVGLSARAATAKYHAPGCSQQKLSSLLLWRPGAQDQGPHWFLPRPGSLAYRWRSPPRVATGPSLCICLCPSFLSLQG